jgi:hexosaminidase
MQGDAAIEPQVYGTARLKDTYTFDILPAGIDSAYVLGGQGNLWTEKVPSIPQVEYMTYPRAFAIAETLWSPKASKNWSNFTVRVEDHFKRFDLAAINYATSLYDPAIAVKKNKEGKLTIELKTDVDGIDIFYSVDNTVPGRYHTKYSAPIVFPAGADMFRVISYRNGKPLGRMISLKTEELEKRVKK